MRNLVGKRALITGAASGIGRAIVLALAAEKTHVYLLDINEAGAGEVAQAAQALGVEAIAARCDVTQPAQITASIREMLERWPEIDILVNNVGVAYYGPTENMTAEQWDWLLQINLHAPIQFTRELIHPLMARPEAHILNVCSIAGLVAGGRSAAYQVSKFGLVGFTEALRSEFVRKGVGLTALCPGAVRTNLYRAAVSGRPNKPVPEPPAWICATPEQVARKAIRGIKKNSAMVLVTPLAYLLWYFKRIAPGLVDRLNCIGHRKRRPAAAQKSTSQPVDSSQPFSAPDDYSRSEGRFAPGGDTFGNLADVQQLAFMSGGVACDAWLIRPPAARQPMPVVLMAHGFAAEKSFGLIPYAEHFVRRGLAVMLFDYRHFGASGGAPRNLVSCRRQREDWQAALNVARQLPGIDPTRIALWGTSFSGGHVVDCASRNPDVAAVVAQVPMLDVPASLGKHGLRYCSQAVWHGLRDLFRAATFRTPHLVPIVGRPEVFAVMNNPGCDEGYRRLVPLDAEWPNACPARILLTSILHRPIARASHVKAPTLLVIAEQDQLISARSIRKAAGRMENATLITVAGDHFSPYYGETFHHVVAREANFLENCLCRTMSLPFVAPARNGRTMRNAA
ncbi:MAG TPA: SDR family NAD(P)-dependent oxidoreductase [Pirellulales bacterium]|jgi:NAD(P)-dependent dehydrogenase (short-subunit alcohol dehydrogenase family)/dienelactone hydrolase|nr:SDR family NAD(P)-dependent oxidoreductase [Pirellulales bacterium]